MKTQAELDVAVIEAAEAWTHEPYSEGLRMRLQDAVRARREAMRPMPAHKAAVALAIRRHELGSCLCDEEMMAWWDDANDSDKAEARSSVSRLLAAPDEQTEGR